MTIEFVLIQRIDYKCRSQMRIIPIFCIGALSKNDVVLLAAATWFSNRFSLAAMFSEAEQATGTNVQTNATRIRINDAAAWHVHNF